MSTKIYNGLEIDYPGSFYELRVALIKLSKEVILPLATQELQKLCARMAFQELDEDRWDNRSDHHYAGADMNDLILKSWAKISHRLETIKDTHIRDNAVDWSASIILFPISNKMLAIPFIGHPILASLLNKQSFVKPYPYWNNSDQPEEISDQEWDIRRQEWDEALDHGSPAQNGFTIELIKESFMPAFNFSEIEAQQPILEERIEYLCKKEIVRYIDEKYALKNPVFNNSSYMQFVNSAHLDEAFIMSKKHIYNEISECLHSANHAFKCNKNN